MEEEYESVEYKIIEDIVSKENNGDDNNLRDISIEFIRENIIETSIEP